MGDPADDRSVCGKQSRAVSYPHAAPALLATLLVVVVLLVGGAYARSVTYQTITSLGAALNDQKHPLFEQKNQGSVLQRAAFSRADLLPAYGASELLDAGELYHARVLFHEYAVDFDLFPIAREGAPILGVLQKVASVGPAARGAKVVISVSPGLFLDPMSPPDYYAGSFSSLQAGELVFSGDISSTDKRGAARRMLDYPRTLADDPLLRIALECLSDESLPAQACYAALQPIGQMRTQALRLQDEFRALQLVGETAHSSSPGSGTAPAPDWDSLMARAERDYLPVSGNNPFGFWDAYWTEKQGEILPRRLSSSDEAFTQRLHASKSWTDLDLLLQGLRDLGAEPLVISSPLHGAYYQFLGVSPTARAAYYERLRALTQANGAALVDFASYEDDLAFATDQWGHLSPKGWVAYARVMDEFHRGVLQ
jgi:D-alanine transfer protein